MTWAIKYVGGELDGKIVAKGFETKEEAKLFLQTNPSKAMSREAYEKVNEYDLWDEYMVEE